ncbi:MAG TPA: carboxypeptidase-like regulatory domain-containing protein [Bacteroidia bacterium]|jgi:hypothetical protein|nr:carboxypeptidase-like regulatory domain-containing protein [Bacteroidia bacterium]
MTPHFPCRNLIINSLQGFTEKQFAFDFAYSIQPGFKPFADSNFITRKIEYYDSLFRLFEDEIYQTTFSGNITLINSLFLDIKERRKYLFPIRESMLKDIERWNNEAYLDYEKKVIEKTRAYFSNDKFADLKHLEEYQDFMPESIFDPQKFKEVTRTYYDFYCVEDVFEEPFNESAFQPYMDFLNEQATKMADFIDKYIKRYDKGEFVKKELEDTYYDKTFKKAKNKKWVVWPVFIVLIIGGLATFKKDITELFSPITPGKDTTTVKNANVIPLLKMISGTVIDEQKNPVKDAAVNFMGKENRIDTTDSFGKFLFTDLSGSGITTETIGLKCLGFKDVSLKVKIDYRSAEPLSLDEIILVKAPQKSNQQLCEEGNSEACYKYADELQRQCSSDEEQARIVCIMKVEMWQRVGDYYEELMKARKDSGYSSHAFIEAKKKWNEAKIMAKKEIIF